MSLGIEWDKISFVHSFKIKTHTLLTDKFLIFLIMLKRLALNKRMHKCRVSLTKRDFNDFK